MSVFGIFQLLPALFLMLFMSVGTSVGQTDGRPTAWYAFQPEIILRQFVQWGIVGLRTVADVRYDEMTVDPITGRLVLTGLDVAGVGPASACRVSVDRATLGFGAIDDIAHMRFRLEAAGLDVAPNCADMAGAPVVQAMAPDGLVADRVFAEMVYSFASGGGSLTFQADAPDLALIELVADFDYVAFLNPDMVPRPAPEPGDPPRFRSNDPIPVVRLASAHLAIEDRGAFGRAAPFLPPEASSPDDVRLMIGAGLSQGFVQMNEGQAATEAQARFARDLSGAAAEFVANGRPLVIETRPENGPVTLDEDAFENPAELFAALAPRVGTRPTPPSQLLSADLVVQALTEDGRAGLSDTDRRVLGLALARGQGVPRAPAQALDVLGDQISDPEIAMALAEASAANAPAQAYAHALTAASGGAAGALGLLDRIEAQLGPETYLPLQRDSAAAPTDAEFASPGAVRAAAHARMTGAGSVRDYGGAYRLANLAAAVGDAASKSLLDEIDSKMRLSSADETWVALREQMRAAALQDWIDRDLGTVFGQ